MSATTLAAKKLDLVQYILAINEESALDKIAEYLKTTTDTNESGLTEETEKMVKRSRKEYADGKVFSFDSAADAQKWLEAL